LEQFWTALVSLLIGIFGGGGLIQLLRWIRLPNDKDREELRKERRDFIKRLERKNDQLENRLEERGEEITSLIAENLRLKAQLGDQCQENP